MQQQLIKKLFLEGIDIHHIGDNYIAFTLNGWKYAEVPIEYTTTFDSIINYLKY